MAGQILGWINGSNMASAPAHVYVSIHDGDPGDAGTAGTDITVSVHAAGRVEADFGSVTAKAITNSAAVDFGSSGADEHCDYFGMWDAQSAGHFLGRGALSSARDILTGGEVQFEIGDLTVQL